ncbi:MAG: PEP-CTERM sorting domain-containing protein [Caulobacteraceae bacterium]|nr:PEP-CTERM sorting domain-containing protein [Caulobacteraceae bacterium]
MRLMQTADVAFAVLLVSMVAAETARAAESDTKATGQSSDWWGTTVGWTKDRIFYATQPPLPTGRWDDQYMNSFAGVPTPPGAGWNTWSFLNKPATVAGWTGEYYSNPAPRTDKSALGSIDQNSTDLYLYRGFFFPNDLYQIKYTKSYAYVPRKAKADNPAVAETRITDPYSPSDPISGQPWSIGLDYAQFGAIGMGNPADELFDQYGITLNPTGTRPVTYNLYSIQLFANGTASITTDLNGNDASETGMLTPGLNGVLTLDGMDVTAAQATTDLEKFYNPSTGWDLNPKGYTISTFKPDNPSYLANVFAISATVFLPGSVASANLTSVDESIAEAVNTDAPIPEPAAWGLMALGAGLVGGALRRSRRAPGRIEARS